MQRMQRLAMWSGTHTAFKLMDERELTPMDATRAAFILAWADADRGTEVMFRRERRYSGKL